MNRSCLLVKLLSLPRYTLSLFTFLLSCPGLFSQSTLTGKVIAKDSRQPLASVSIYLNNTSIGTTTDDQGIFIIRNAPMGKYRLVATSIGYESFDTLIDTRKANQELMISLNIKPQELEGFDVSPADPDGWKKWGELFTDIFIGTVPARANYCKLTNPELLRFRLNKNNILVVYSKEPLLIFNYALGYEIRYKLEDFEYDFNAKLVTYSGYAFFKDMALTHPGRVTQYAAARWETYRGSLLHFMRAFYANDLEAQGFEMRSLGQISNPEKDLAKRWLSLHKDSVGMDSAHTRIRIHQDNDGQDLGALKDVKTDSTDYFKKILLQPDSIISHQLITADSIGFAADSTIAGMYFQDSLEVSYLLKEVPGRYRNLSKEHKHESYPISQFVFTNKKPIFILYNGYYYNPYDLKITGFWAWSECISTRLPYDYSPIKQQRKVLTDKDVL